jgi:hypothetical protein
MLSVANKPFMLRVILRNGNRLSVALLIILAPLKHLLKPYFKDAYVDHLNIFRQNRPKIAMGFKK